MRKQVEQAIRTFVDSKAQTEEVQQGKILATEVMRLNRSRAKTKKQVAHMLERVTQDHGGKHG